MNVVLNTGLTFWQLFSTLIALVISFVAIKVTLNFDLNRYLENRQKTLMMKLKNFCTHMDLTLRDDGKIEVKSFFISPPGTLQWQCQRCGLMKHQNDDSEQRMADFYIKNPDEYQKKNRMFTKLLRKSGLL